MLYFLKGEECTIPPHSPPSSKAIIGYKERGSGERASLYKYIQGNRIDRGDCSQSEKIGRQGDNNLELFRYNLSSQWEKDTFTINTHSEFGELQSLGNLGLHVASVIRVPVWKRGSGPVVQGG